MKCSACPNPAFDNHPKAPLCLPCLRAWREFEDSPRITQPYEVPEFSDEDRRLRVDVVFREFDIELRKRDADLARKIRLALATGDRGLQELGSSLTPEEAVVGFNAMIVAVTRTWGTPGVPA